MAFFDPKLYKHLLNDGFYAPIVNQSSNTTFYFTAGRVDEWNSGPFSPEFESGTSDQIADVRQNLIAGTRLGPSNVAFLGQRTVWQSNVVYATFDSDIAAPFYVINSSNDLYKCIGNNNGARSLVEPTATFTSGTFTTADGYVWKYLTTVSLLDLATFGSANTIPLLANTEVQTNAVKGTIDAVTVVNRGALYGKFSTGRVGAQLSNTLIRVNNIADESINFYSNTSFVVVGGTGAGTITTVSNSVSNSSGVFLTVANTITVDITSRFIISPQLIVDGDGTGFKGYINLDGDAVANVVVTSPGQNYTYAVGTVSYPDTTVPATFRFHIAPNGGHGSDLVNELKSTSIALTGKFTKTMGQYLPNDITYYQFALMKSPKNSSGAVLTANTIAFTTSFETSNVVFSRGEEVRGQTSNAFGVVLSSNSSITYLKAVAGNFQNTETVIGSDTTEGATISSVLTSSYDKTSGQLLYYINASAINRTDTIDSENIRCVINIEG